MAKTEDVTRILNEKQLDGMTTAEELLPLIYEELRQLARRQMANEAAGHTLQPTALVHEAWLRLNTPHRENWQNRAHFFGAAAEAMRRILVDHIRRRRALKRGADAKREPLEDSSLVLQTPPDEILAVHESLDALAQEDPVAAELVKLRYFVGMNREEAAEALELTPRTADRLWAYARVWLRRAIRQQLQSDDSSPAKP